MDEATDELHDVRERLDQAVRDYTRLTAQRQGRADEVEMVTHWIVVASITAVTDRAEDDATEVVQIRSDLMPYWMASGLLQAASECSDEDE